MERPRRAVTAAPSGPNMSWSWSTFLAVYVLAIAGVIFAASLGPTIRRAFVAARYHWDPLTVITRMGSFFTPLSAESTEDPLTKAMNSWMWLPQLVFLGSLTILVYLAGQMTIASIGYSRIVLPLLGAIMLAAGLADITGRAIATWRYTLLTYPESMELGLYHVNIFWSPDVFILGIWLCILAIPGVILVHQVRRPGVILLYQLRRRAAAISQATQPMESDSPADAGDHAPLGDLRAPCVQRTAAKLATLGIIPILVLSFIGGTNQYSSYPYYSGDLDLRKTFFNHVLSDFVFYLKLRSSPPVTESFGYADSYGMVAPGKWLLSVAIVVIFVACLWLALRSILSSPTAMPGGALFLASWGMTVLAGALVGTLDDLFNSEPAQLFTLNFDLLSYNGNLALFDGMLFGVLWGWLVGLTVFLGYQQTRILATESA